MMILDTAPESVAPLLYFLVGEGNGVDAVGFHQRMRGARGAVDVKFFFEKRVHGAVQAEGISGRLSHTEPAVQIKTARAVQEQIYFGAAQTERLRRGRIKNILYPLGVVVLRHENLLPCGTLPLFQL